MTALSILNKFAANTNNKAETAGGTVMPEQDLPPQQARLRVEQDLPPQSRSVMLYAAGGGFVGALLAILVAKILAGPCCCAAPAAGAAAVDLVQERVAAPV